MRDVLGEVFTQVCTTASSLVAGDWEHPSVPMCAACIHACACRTPTHMLSHAHWHLPCVHTPHGHACEHIPRGCAHVTMPHTYICAHCTHCTNILVHVHTAYVHTCVYICKPTHTAHVNTPVHPTCVHSPYHSYMHTSVHTTHAHTSHMQLHVHTQPTHVYTHRHTRHAE